MSTKAKLEKGIWRSDVYYQLAKRGSQDTHHPGMIILKDAASKASSILDLGCGEGTRLNFISAKNKKSLGIDISQKGIELAKKRYPKLNFIKADLENIPLKDNSFDLVYSAYVLEHLDKVEKVLKEAIRLVKPGGYLVLIAPNYGAPNRCSPPFKDSRLSKLTQGFLNDFFTREELNWNKVTPIAKHDKYDVDWDTTIEPYLGSLIIFLRSHNFRIKKADSCWSQELPNAKPHQKLFRLLGEKNIYPFSYWGPHLVVLAQK